MRFDRVHRYLSIALFALLFAMSASESQAADPQWTVTGPSSPELSRVDDAMRSFMMQNDIRQGAVAITKDGRLVHARGYTWAVTGYPVTQVDTVFRIASVSKPITSILIHQLIAEGAISYETRVVDYLGLEPPAGRSLDPRLRDVTIDHLLRHTGGWNRDQAFDPMFYDAPISSSLGVSRPITKYDIATYMNGQNLQSAPGQRYSYSNYGYSLLGMVIEKATGLDYTDAVRQRVFAPLGVTRPRLGHQFREDRAPNEAIYENSADGYNQENLDSHGGWILAAPDMVRLLTIFDHKDDNPLLSRDSIEAMFSRDGNASYARGWEISSGGNGLTAYGHTGRLAPGMRSAAAWIGGNPNAALDGVAVFVVVTRNDRDPGNTVLSALQQITSWPSGDLFEETGITGAIGQSAPVESWIQIAGHADGDAGSRWRSDVSLLNRSPLPNKVRVRSYDAIERDLEVELDPGEQLVVEDVVEKTGGRDFGPVRVYGSDSVTVSSRTYNQSPSGTFGQFLGQVKPRTGLRTGDAAVLPGLRENEAFRTNIGIHNAGRRQARVQVALFDAEGTELASFEESIRASSTLQLNAPFLTQASRSDIDSGYATVSVTFGDDVTSYASVIDRRTNDPTTIPTKRSNGSVRQWIAAAARVGGAQGSEWRTDLTLLNLSGSSQTVSILFHKDGGAIATHETSLAPGEQKVLEDIVASFEEAAAGFLEVVSTGPVIALSRTYNASDDGSFGQFIDAEASGLSTGDVAWLPQLRHDESFRTNLGILNAGDTEATIRIELRDTSGDVLGESELTIDAATRLQIGSAFFTIAGVSAVRSGYATVEVVDGSRIVVLASVVDNLTNDPTTVAAIR